LLLQARPLNKRFRKVHPISAHLVATTDAKFTAPAIRRIRPADLFHALARGADDFAAMPSHAVFLCVIYPLLGMVLIGIAFGYSMLPLAFPIAAGFALIGPLAAIGLYELSRRREAGLDNATSHALDVLHSPSLGAVVALGLLLMVIFLIWLAVAQSIYVAFFGYSEPASIGRFVHDVFATRAGLYLIVAGTGVGFLFAAAVLAIGVVSFPLLLDRDVGAAVALLTSIRVVAANPVTMALWGLIVAALLAIGSLPFFLGLTVAVPVLAHTTWHLYRRAVVPDPNPRPDHRPRAKAPRYAADFPAALFPTRRCARVGDNFSAIPRRAASP
jgi:uncharacterized membrane protein